MAGSPRCADPGGIRRCGPAVTVAAGSRLRFRDAHIAIQEHGSGTAVGYLHGFVGNPGLHPFLESLAGSGRHVIAPSLPGFTGSAPSEDLRGLYDWVVATSEVIDKARMPTLNAFS